MADLQKMHDFLELYLQKKEINTNTAFRCVSPEHEDKNPSMSFYKKAKKCTCFACGEKYDIFRLVGMEYNLKTFKEQLKKVQELMKNPELIESAQKTIYSQKKNANLKIQGNIEIQSPKENFVKYEAKGYEAYFLECKKRVGLTDYLKKRGISWETADKMNIGFDPNFKAGEWKALIIPTSYTSFTARNTDILAKDRLRKVGHLETFNYWCLKDLEKSKPVFVVEGEIDALSLLETGQQSIALGSIKNITLFVEKLKKDMPENPFYLLLDNDSPGKQAQKELYEKMNKIDLNVKELFLKAYKDPNDFLVKNRMGFEVFLSESLSQEKNKKVNPWEEKLNREKQALVR